jgi:hypothetical protein
MSTSKKFKRLVHLDEKVIKPDDITGSNLFSSSDNDKIITEEKSSNVSHTRGGSSKTIIGKPKIYDLKGNLLVEEENLVVLIGREFLAQLLAGTQGNNGNNYLDYKVKYFGVGNEGASGTPPTTIGPYDDDLDLGFEQDGIHNSRVVIKTPTGVDVDYIDSGKLKRIESDGEITIVEEDHTINTEGGGQIVVQKYTAVKYTMYLQQDEPEDKPFKFNEAGLFAVRYEYDANLDTEVPTEDYLLFARFTTLDKYLDTADGIVIEWYILV